MNSSLESLLVQPSAEEAVLSKENVYFNELKHKVVGQTLDTQRSVHRDWQVTVRGTHGSHALNHTLLCFTLNATIILKN